MEPVQRWRDRLRDAGVWANDPVPLFPYPGSPDYRRLWGVPDDNAWERAVDYYLDRYATLSEIQDFASAPARRSRGALRIMIETAKKHDRPPAVLMTADAVGGVWSYAVGLCRSLPETRFVLATMGPRPDQAQRATHSRASKIVTLVESDYHLEWMARRSSILRSSRDWLIDLIQRHEVDVVHVNGYAHARLGGPPRGRRRTFGRALLVGSGPQIRRAAGMGRISQTSHCWACRGHPHRRADAPRFLTISNAITRRWRAEPQ